MKKLTSLFYLIQLFLLSVSTAMTIIAQSQQGPLNLDDLGTLLCSLNPSISPDGSQVVVVREHTNYEHNRYERSLELIDLETGKHRELTPERLRVDDPQWSPSGDRLAFLDADEEGPVQLYVLPMRGGEARRLTNGKEGVRFYEWSPDGRSIVFGRMDEPEEREGEERHNRSFEVGDNSYLTQSRPKSTHLWRFQRTAVSRNA
jgi:dipeptidyl aminopeptidase/acylaminoacyl peptidase